MAICPVRPLRNRIENKYRTDLLVLSVLKGAWFNTVYYPIKLLCKKTNFEALSHIQGQRSNPNTHPFSNFRRLIKWYTHKTSGFKTSGFKTSGFKTSETSGIQNVRFTKRQVYKTSGLQDVRLTKRQVFKTSAYKKTSIYILYLWLVEIRRICFSHVCRKSDGRVLFSILEGFLPYITVIASNK
jgi:hypothetical protein